ncbi:Tubulinyl-Tyr carboxypeptidase 1, partial [Cladochytrium tenue]
MLRRDYPESYLDALGYNHVGAPFFKVNKAACVRDLADVAAGMVKFGLPIKCLEAVVLAISISFKSTAGGEVFRHIVLGLRWNNLYGALGLSRRSDLMFKALRFVTLDELVAEFKRSYEKNGHQLLKVKLGAPITHDKESLEPVPWK